MELKADIIDYMGKMDSGILVLLSINCNNKFTEGTIFYTDNNFTITVSEDVEKELGCVIEQWSGYINFAESILKKLVPCNELLSRIDEVDFSQYLEYDGETYFINDEIDPDEIEKLDE
jgi:hypothetical protein